MAKFITLKPRKFFLQFRDSHQACVHGSQLALAALLQEFGLAERLQRGPYLECMARYFGTWSVSYNQWTGPLEAKAAELPPSAWSEAETTVWRDGTVQTAQYGWFRYQPGGCGSPQRFAGVRHRAAEEMFWRDAFLTTHRPEGAARLADSSARRTSASRRRWSAW